MSVCSYCSTEDYNRGKKSLEGVMSVAIYLFPLEERDQLLEGSRGRGGTKQLREVGETGHIS